MNNQNSEHDSNRNQLLKFLLTLLTDLRQQLFQHWLTLLIGFILGIVVIFGIWVLNQTTGVALSKLTRDHAAIYHTPIYIGLLSQLGIMLWSATIGVCFLAAAILSHIKQCRQAYWFLLGSGLLCLWLTLDDALLFHEDLFPYYLHIPQFLVYIGYAVIFSSYLLYFRQSILMTDYLLLLLSVFLLGSSVILDQFFPFSNLETFVEDSLKFMGIIFWLAYFTHTAIRIIREALSHE